MTFLRRLRSEQDRIYVDGESEFEMTAYLRKHGVPLHAKAWDGLTKLAGKLGIPFELAK